MKFDTEMSSGPVTTRSGYPHRRNIAVIGTGISGLSAAWALHRDHDVTVFEKEDRIGGHTNTVMVETDNGPLPVDTGFIVYNEPNYPNLTALFKRLGVASNETDMHFSVSARERDLEYASNGLRGLFADPKNLTRPSFFRMLRDLMRFHAAAPALAVADTDISIGEYLSIENYGKAFVSDHLLPMAAAIWSCPAETIMDFPARSLARFFVNHGLVELKPAFPWHSVSGGSHSYIKPLTNGFEHRIRLNAQVTEVHRENGKAVITLKSGETLAFDEVIMACHGPQAAALLSDADTAETEILKAFKTQPNRAVLHTDPSLMPRRRRAWASWNYLSEQTAGDDLSVTYWMNALQHLDTTENYFVTLNPAHDPSPDHIISAFDYQHPIFDAQSIAAQRDIWNIQGRGNIWYCGAWLGYGFHEDGLQAGLAVAELMSDWRRPWAFDYGQERLARNLQKAQVAA